MQVLSEFEFKSDFTLINTSQNIKELFKKNLRLIFLFFFLKLKILTVLIFT